MGVNPNSLNGVNIYGSSSQQNVSEKLVLLRCLIPGNVKVVGVPSITEYNFIEGAKEQYVKEVDVPDLLAKIKISGCCGYPKIEQRMFELVK